MPFYRMNGLMMHLNLAGKARRNPPKACSFFLKTKAGERVRCLQMAPYLCDWPGCDAPICEDHVLHLGPDLDVCPTHNARRGLFSRLLPAPQGTQP